LTRGDEASSRVEEWLEMGLSRTLDEVKRDENVHNVDYAHHLQLRPASRHPIPLRSVKLMATHAPCLGVLTAPEQASWVEV
jgi:hypothetical protein